MKFQIGDKVSVLDDDISGVIVAMKDDDVSIETSDGFVLEFLVVLLGFSHVIF